MPLDPRPCLVCNRGQDDLLHGPDGGRAEDVTPRIEHHDYDPGERRHLVRRMDDRVKRIEDSLRRIGPGRRRTDREET